MFAYKIFAGTQYVDDPLPNIEHMGAAWVRGYAFIVWPCNACTYTL